MGFSDFLFPKKCVVCRKIGEYVCVNCFATLSFDVKLLCVVCNHNTLDGLTHPACKTSYTIDGVFSGLVYHMTVRKLLYAFKYQPYVSDVGGFMATLLYEGLIQQELFLSILARTQPLLIPIPLSKKSFKERGYNHAKILADGMKRKFALPVIDSLQRIKETKPQFGLKREERIINIKDAFSVKKSFVGKLPKQVFLIDDVLTSGSTLAEAAYVLKRGGVENVWGVTFAREQNR